MNRVLSFTGAVLFLGLSLAGCGTGPKLYKNTVTVKYKGAAVAGANVTVNYADGDLGAGITGADGKAEFATGNRPGLKAGKHKVTVQKMAAPSTGAATMMMNPTPSTDPAEAGKSNAELKTKMDGMKGMGGTPPPQTGAPKNELPAKYASATTTDLEIEVKANGVDHVLELKD